MFKFIYFFSGYRKDSNQESLDWRSLNTTWQWGVFPDTPKCINTQYLAAFLILSKETFYTLNWCNVPENEHDLSLDTTYRCDIFLDIFILC